MLKQPLASAAPLDLDPQNLLPDVPSDHWLNEKISLTLFKTGDELVLQKVALFGNPSGCLSHADDLSTLMNMFATVSNKPAPQMRLSSFSGISHLCFQATELVAYLKHLNTLPSSNLVATVYGTLMSSKVQPNLSPENISSRFEIIDIDDEEEVKASADNSSQQPPAVVNPSKKSPYIPALTLPTLDEVEECDEEKALPSIYRKSGSSTLAIHRELSIDNEASEIQQALALSEQFSAEEDAEDNIDSELDNMLALSLEAFQQEQNKASEVPTIKRNRSPG